jgi:hypothetical protein
MTSQENIALAIQTLLTKNQTPTVAKIKSQLPIPLPMREIIQGLQHWQRHPESLESHTPSKIQEAPQKPTLEARITALEQQVALLIQRLNSIENH